MNKSFIEKKYLAFDENDFLADPFFQEWVCCPTDENNKFWMLFLEKYPEKDTAVKNARIYLKSISFEEHLPTDEQIQQSLDRHLQAIRDIKDTSNEETEVSKPSLPWRNILKYAAILGGVVIVLASYFFFGEKKSEIVQTEFGELRNVILPDSSVVVLNANSKIEYNKKWLPGEKREVWLEGEAFFKVRHINDGVKPVKPEEEFCVYTSGLTVTVLGTSFDIRQRREKTEVVLQSGKIMVSYTDPIRQKAEIIMKPGDMFIYSHESRKVDYTTVLPEDYTAWEKSKLILQSPSVNEIINYLEDNFGKRIILEDKNMGNKVIDGPIHLSTLDDALFVLSTILNTKVIKPDTTTVILRPR